MYEDSENIYALFEYCREGNLAEYIESKGPIPENEAVQIIMQILLTLDILHIKGIIHRDLKPSNILFKSKAPQPLDLCIGDFGLSCFL